MSLQVQKIYLSKHLHFKEIDSTNTWAKQHPKNWADQGITLITASYQTAGRGRFKRLWVSPPNVNIYATFCFWWNSKRLDIGHIPQILAISASQIIDKQGFSSHLKWPNDVLLKGKKVAGILCETILEKEKRGIICGIGLNVNMSKEIVAEIDRPATSLRIEGEQIYCVSQILEDLKNLFIHSLNEFIEKGFAPFFPIFQERSSLKKGDKICFHDNQNLLKGEFEQLHSNGSVELRLSDGSKKIFYAGEFI